MAAIDKLKKQKDHIEKRIQLLKARERQQQHKQDLQRKILIGSYYLSQAQAEGRYEELVQHMDSFLARKSDRKLFNLPEKEESKYFPIFDQISKNRF